MAKTNVRKKRVNFTMDPKLHERLGEHSKESGFSQSVIVSIALSEYLKRKDKEK